MSVASSSADPGPTDVAGPPPEKRGSLLLLWCLWLLGSWAVLWVQGGWTVPALRLMLMSAAFGMLAVWPAMRLSQPTVTPARGRTPRAASPAKSAHHARLDEPTPRQWARACGTLWRDWIALLAVFQAVVWPLQLAANWNAAQVLWLNAAMAGWGLLTALLIAWGRGSNRPSWRQLAMLVCLGVIVLEPLLLALGVPHAGGGSSAAGLPTMRISPIQALWILSAPGDLALDNGIAQSTQWTFAGLGAVSASVLSVWFAALAGWTVLAVLLLVRLKTTPKPML